MLEARQKHQNLRTSSLRQNNTQDVAFWSILISDDMSVYE